jgi:superfamily II DNA/RNA helicase
VDALAQVSLRKPVRVRADASFEVAPRLVQEFVRVRHGSEEHRHAILLALVARTYKHRTLAFVSTKVRATV